MRQHGRRHALVATRIGPLAAGAAIVLSGCQKYERQPLDLRGHRAQVDARSLELGGIPAFIDRLDALDVDAPEALILEDGLTPAEGEVLALFYNPALRQARADAGIALATRDNAGLWDDPVFGFDHEQVLDPTSPLVYGLTLRFTIPISGRLEVEKARAGAAYEAALRNIVDAEWRLRHDVRRSWAAWTIALERLHLLRQTQSQVEHITILTDRLEALDDLSRVEARLFRVELADRRAAVAQAAYEARESKIELLWLMGLDADSPIDLIPAMPTSPVADITDPVQRMIEHNTELAVRIAQYETAEETLRLEIKKQFPDITVGPGYGKDDDANRFLLGISVPIPILNANRLEIARARAGRDLARTKAEVMLERLRRTFAVTTRHLESITLQRKTYETEVVPLLESQSSEVEHVAALGEVDTLLLLETVTRQIDARLRLLSLHYEDLDAHTTIAQLLGPSKPARPAPVSDESDTAIATNQTPPSGGAP